jgi:hypothetical protein
VFGCVKGGIGGHMAGAGLEWYAGEDPPEFAPCDVENEATVVRRGEP